MNLRAAGGSVSSETNDFSSFLETALDQTCTICVTKGC